VRTSRDNSPPTFLGVDHFPLVSVGSCHDLSLIQSNFGSPGNLEVVARVGNRLAFLFFLIPVLLSQMDPSSLPLAFNKPF